MAKSAIKYLDGIKVREVGATQAEYEEYKQLGKRIKYKCPCEQNDIVCGADMTICGGSEYTNRRGTKVIKKPYFESSPNSVHQMGCPNTPKGARIINVYARAVGDISLDDYFDLYARPDRENPEPGGGGPVGPDGPIEPIEDDEDEGEAAVRVVRPRGLSRLYEAIRDNYEFNVLRNGQLCREALINYRSYQAVRDGEIVLDGRSLVLMEKCHNNDLYDAFGGKISDGNLMVVLQDPYIGDDANRTYYILKMQYPDTQRMKDRKTRFFDTLKGEDERIFIILGNWVKVTYDGFEQYNIYETEITYKYIDVLQDERYEAQYLRKNEEDK